MSSGTRRLLGLDALRGIAAVAVMLFHYTGRFYQDFGRPEGALPAVPYDGMQGVFLFFILSGFVISMTLERTAGLREFALSRFSRIYPAYWVCALLTFTVVALLGLPGREVGVGTLLLNLTMLHGYFNVPSVDWVYWSLEAELAFYVLAYLFHSRGWLADRAHALGWSWLGWCVGWELLLRARGIALPDLIMWGTLSKFAPLFVAGIMFRRLHTGRGTWVTHAIILASFAAHNLIHWQSKLNFLVTIASYGAFYVLVYRGLSFLAVRPLIFLGEISYTLYLVHHHIGLAVILRMVGAGVPYVAALMVAIATSLLLAWGVHVAVEKPAMTLLRQRLARPKAALAEPSRSP